MTYVGGVTYVGGMIICRRRDTRRRRDHTRRLSNRDVGIGGVTYMTGVT